MSLFARAIACSLALAIAAAALPARAEGVAVEQASDEQKAQARAHFARARQAFDQRRFTDALEGFKASYDVVASPNARLMIAHTLRELGRTAEAYDELVGAVKQAEDAAAADPKYAGSAESARQEMAEVRAKVGLLTVTVVGDDPKATLTVAGRHVERARWGQPVAVDPGTITVSLSSELGSTVKEVLLTAGGDAQLAIEAKAGDAPPPPPPPPEPEGADGWNGDTQRIVSYAVGGLGAASLVVMGVFGGLALKKHNELNDACGDSPCPERQSDIDGGKTFKLVSNVTLIAGVVLLGAGVTLYFTAPDDATDAPAPTALVLGPGSVMISGSF